MAVGGPHPEIASPPTPPGPARRIDSRMPTGYACTGRGSSRVLTQHLSWYERIPMSTLTLAYAVHTYSTGTPGRAICNARTHHFVSDDVGGDAVGAGELFLSGVSACAVNMVERLARQGWVASTAVSPTTSPAHVADIPSAAGALRVDSATLRRHCLSMPNV